MNLIVLVLALDLVLVPFLQQVQCMPLPYFLVEEPMIKGTIQHLVTVVGMAIQLQVHRTMAATANTTSLVHHLLLLLRTITAKGQDKGRLLIKWVDTMIQINSIMASME
jgi:hypothetical protein